MTNKLFGERREITPGALHIPGWLSVDLQQRLVAHCTKWMQPPAPARSPRIRGGQMSVKMACLGWYWVPYRYVTTAIDTDDSPVEPMPDWLVDLGQRAVREAFPSVDTTNYVPDVAMINLYEGHAKMGMHQDRDEQCDAPVVSLSLGDTCVFRFGNTTSRGRPYTDLELASGDLFVFGAESRFAYHGVTKVLANSGDPSIGLARGRINVTLRMTGLTHQSLVSSTTTSV